MATKKITITLPEEILAALRVQASSSGVPLSTYIAGISEHHARIRAGLAESRRWESEHGAFTVDEMAAIDREIAQAEAGLPVSESPDSESLRRTA